MGLPSPLTRPVLVPSVVAAAGCHKHGPGTHVHAPNTPTSPVFPTGLLQAFTRTQCPRSHTLENGEQLKHSGSLLFQSGEAAGTDRLSLRTTHLRMAQTRASAHQQPRRNAQRRRRGANSCLENAFAWEEQLDTKKTRGYTCSQKKSKTQIRKHGPK